MPFKVFISYSWENSAERRALEAELSKDDSVELIVDRKKIKPGDPIHHNISKMIVDAECIVVFLTKEGLESVEVRDELSRCHDRGKKIIPVVMKDIDLKSLPWYLRDINFIEYDNKNFDAVLDRLKIAIFELSKPFELDNQLLPQNIKTLLKNETKFIDLVEKYKDKFEYINSPYIYLELKMQRTKQKFVIRVPIKASTGEVSKIIAYELFPELSSESYVWSINFDEQEIPSFHTFETSNINSGASVYLKGTHPAPVIIPMNRNDYLLLKGEIGCIGNKPTLFFEVKIPDFYVIQSEFLINGEGNNYSHSHLYYRIKLKFKDRYVFGEIQIFNHPNQTDPFRIDPFEGNFSDDSFFAEIITNRNNRVCPIFLRMQTLKTKT